jgi:type II secretion system protein J
LKRTACSGFTLLEILIATAVLTLLFSMTFSVFSGVLQAWRRGTEAAADLHHGDYVMEQLCAALRSAAYVEEDGARYGFRLENRDEADRLSWVTLSPAFAGPDAPWRHGMHRIEVSVGGEADENGFYVRLYSHFAESERVAAVEFDRISDRISGLNCRVYDAEQEVWLEEWEDTNSVPALLEVVLITEPHQDSEDEAPLRLRRLVEIPVVERIENPVDFSDPPANTEAAASPPRHERAAEAVPGRRVK